jgi:hypothetical protein
MIEIGQCNSICNLLDAWGYERFCICSLDDLRRFLAQAPALLICDAASLATISAELPAIDHPPKMVVLGDASKDSVPGLRIEGWTSLPLRPARLRALLHHLLHEEEEEQALESDTPSS